MSTQTAEARDWAVQGWVILYDTIEGEWGPYGVDYFIAEHLSGAPEWLVAAVRSEIAAR